MVAVRCNGKSGASQEYVANLEDYDADNVGLMDAVGAATRWVVPPAVFVRAANVLRIAVRFAVLLASWRLAF